MKKWVKCLAFSQKVRIFAQLISNIRNQQLMNDMIQKFLKTVVLGVVLMMAVPAAATKVLGLKVIDKNYLMVHFRDGEVHYRDDGTGPSAYLGHSFAEGDDTLLVFGERLVADRAQQAALWRISSVDDKTFGNVRPQHVWRKSKPMNFDHTLTAELDHWLFLQLPKAMKQGCTYTVTIPKGIGAETTSLSVCFDIWNSQSEAVHVNIIGYVPSEQTHAADLYQWLGDGGQRDYKDFEGRQVYLYNGRRWPMPSRGWDDPPRPQSSTIRHAYATRS